MHAEARFVLALNCGRNGGNFVVWWPTSAVGFILEGNTNLLKGNWTPIPSSPVVVGNEYFVTNAIMRGEMFFRLRK